MKSNFLSVMKHILAFTALLLTPLAALPAAETKSARPNIVYLLADDLGYADVGFTGGKDIRTPHLDQLAAAGAVLESHYVQPLCSPTRASLLTGRYVSHTGVYRPVEFNEPWGLPLAERTLAQALRKAGYETAICGKWHLGSFHSDYLPTKRGFDHQYGHRLGAIDYWKHTFQGQSDWSRDDQPIQEEGYSTHLIAKEACRIIREKPADKPLFLYVPFNAVHGPFMVPNQYQAPYAKLSGPGPAHVRPIYAGMVAAMDEAIGQIVTALKAKGLWDNTLIIFSSDNGGPIPKRITSNGPLRSGKNTIYEGGIRACAFAVWPGRIPGGQHIQEPLHIVDWYPTLITLAGGSLEQPLPLDGRDIWSVLTQGARSPHQDLFIPGNRPDQAALRMGDWKLLVNARDLADDGANERPTANGVELFNLSKDIGEEQNLAAKYPEKVKELQAKLAPWLKSAVAYDLPKVAPDTREKQGGQSGDK